jgi:hypothetical protein
MMGKLILTPKIGGGISMKLVESVLMNQKRRSNKAPANTFIGKRHHRLSDKLRAALARAAALDRHDIAEQLMVLYRTTVVEDIRLTRNRRATEHKSTTIEKPAPLSQYPGANSAER